MDSRVGRRLTGRPGRAVLIFLTIAAAVALAVMAAPSAVADGGPHQGALFGAKPDYCAACHRVHTAQAPRLLKETSQEALCYSCHGNIATGADTNVEGGRYEAKADGTSRSSVWEEAPTSAASAGLKGGGFASAYMDTDLDGNDASATTTSSHKTGGWGDRVFSTSDDSRGLWGGGTTDVAAVNISGFQCGSCHNPHGNSNYRMLRGNPNGMPDESTAPAVDLDDEGREYLYGTSGSGSGVAVTNGANATDGALDGDYATITGWGAVDDSYTFTVVDNPQAALEAAYVEFSFYVSGWVDESLALEYCDGDRGGNATDCDQVADWNTLKTFESTNPMNSPPTSLNLMSYAPAAGWLDDNTELSDAQLRLRISALKDGADNFTLYLDMARIASKAVVETLYGTAVTAAGDLSIANEANMIDSTVDGDVGTVTGTTAAWALADTLTFDPVANPVAATAMGEYLEIRIKGTFTDAGNDDVIDVTVWNGASYVDVGDIVPGDLTANLVTKRYDVSATLTSAALLTGAKIQFIGRAANDATAVSLDIDAARIITGTKVYTVSYDGNNYRDASYVPANISTWCAQCHTKYLANIGAGSDPSAGPVDTTGYDYFQYRHMTSGLTAGCLKCHAAHGSSASMGSYSQEITYPMKTGDTQPLEYNSEKSRLLHVDNRGVCVQCHSGVSAD